MKKSETVSTSEVAKTLKVTRAAVTQWCRQGLFAGAFVEDTARGPVWHVPRSELRTFKKPKTGRPSTKKKTGKVSRRTKKI